MEEKSRKKKDEYDRPIEGTKKKRRYKVHVRRKKNKSEYYHTQKVSIFIEEFNSCTIHIRMEKL